VSLPGGSPFTRPTGTDWVTKIRSPAGRRCNVFTLHHGVQTGCVAHITSHPEDTGALFPGIKVPKREADHSPPSSRVRNPLHEFMACLSTGANESFFTSNSSDGTFKYQRLMTSQALEAASLLSAIALSAADGFQIYRAVVPGTR
jgi:hypothetical protein